ncbi:hypothetical protein GCM10007981_09120 [Thermocladium modestius]|uniref:Uncharacterized protein n=1 Tax=Thermocladium modestius TaxID=62609 RepID=A0A830GT39_9CREN|nr:hypothetical protein [Thermocladium modestius]GGP20557.1 hypothetical protein GCM10007981_09120 [Thermocladium modestius]
MDAFKDLGNEDYRALMRRIAGLPEETMRTVCKYLELGMVVDSKGKAYVTLNGTLMLQGSQLGRDLVEAGIGMEVSGLVVLPGFFSWTYWVRPICPDLEGEEFINVLPMQVFGVGVIPYAELGGVEQGFAELVKGVGFYMVGPIKDVLMRTWIMDGMTFDENVDLLVIADNETIAHKYVDARRSVHMGLSSLERYAQYGFDRLVLMHPFVSRQYHDEVVAKLASRSVISTAGYLVLSMDEYEINGVTIYKWPLINYMLSRSLNVMQRNMELKRFISM